MYIYLYIYISIYIYLYIYTEKERNVLAFFCKRTKRFRVLSRSLQKNGTILAFFPVLCKRTEHSLCSFPFFWVSLVAKNSKKEWGRTERSLKERERPERSERERTRCPTLQLNSILQNRLGRSEKWPR